MLMNRVMMSLILLCFLHCNQELDINLNKQLLNTIILIDVYSLTSGYYTTATNGFDPINTVVQ